MPKEKEQNSQFRKFDKAMDKLLSVSHDDLKAKLDAEKAEKKRKPKVSASVRASDGKG